MIKTKTIYVLSAKSAKEKIKEWYKDKKNLKIFSATPNLEGEGYVVSFAYDEDDKNKIK